ncbi:MATE efflux family protein [Violaceomyces palustris]|uniref:MATE efflux family protein n=1 Tax=Violaceomyces palustris TaxID=1673888 RepID=A0ACD0NTK5_9BASI|nr:MATE efflux family protein [Violaceomyces palustris]
MWLLLRRSVPVSLSYMLQNSIQSISVAVVGKQLDADALSAAAHGYMLAMVTAWCLALGGSTAFDTLASPLYSARRYREVGLMLQRTCLLLLLLYLPVVLVWYRSSSVLAFLGQPEQLCDQVQSFLRVLAFGAPGYILFETVKKFCQVQGIMGASTLVLCFTSPLNAVLNFYLVRSRGLVGAAVATSITYWTSFLLLASFCLLGEPRKCWFGFERRSITDAKGCWLVLRLAIPGILMVGTEWWAFEIVALAAGRLAAPALSAQSVIMTVDQILNTLPFGLGVASSARIGNLLGYGTSKSNLSSLSISSYAATLLATIQGCLVLVTLILTRDRFGSMFSSDQPTIQLVSQVLPLVATFQVFDGWAGACGGVLRGIGKQELGATINLVSYYLLALPLGIFLAFRVGSGEGMGLSGLWIGQDVALGLVGAGELILVCFKTNWRSEAIKAQERMDDGEPDQDLHDPLPQVGETDET